MSKMLSQYPCTGISQGVGEMDGQAIQCKAEDVAHEIQVSLYTSSIT
jgi:hypothetical protein